MRRANNSFKKLRELAAVIFRLTTTTVCLFKKLGFLKQSANRPNPVEMDIHVDVHGSLADPPLSFLDRVETPSDVLLLTSIRHYFTVLRQQKGHQPDASPMDLEILLVIKFIQASCHDPIDLLRKVGIIVMATSNRFYIAINNTLLVDTIVSSRSRINNTLKRLEWEMVPMANPVKYDILKTLLDRSDVRNWTVRVIPTGNALYTYAARTPSVQVHVDHACLVERGTDDAGDAPGQLSVFG
jgi:hypothetical protein